LWIRLLSLHRPDLARIAIELGLVQAVTLAGSAGSVVHVTA